MANQWLRLWHDMPTDPKFKTIARISGEPISLVIAVYMHLLVDASRNVTRGHVTVTHEDLASALDVTDAQIAAIFSAMNGRVLESGHLSGWEKRQPKREDSGGEESGAKTAAQRKKEQREREKAAAELAHESATVTQCHDESRNVTTDKDKEEIKIREEMNTGESADAPPLAKQAKASVVKKPEDIDAQVWGDWIALRKAKKAPVTDTVLKAVTAEAEKARMTTEDFLRIWCLRGSQGLQAAWIKPEERKQVSGKQTQSFAERDAAAGRKRWEEMTGRKHPDNTTQDAGEFIEANGNIVEIES